MSAQNRISHIAAGVILLGFQAVTGNPVGWLGVIPLVVGIIGRCPLGRLLGAGRSHGGH